MTKIVLFADGLVGQRIATYLVSSFPNDVAFVVTTIRNEISASCDSAGIENFVFESETATIANIKRSNVDFGILAWWPKIIRQELISVAKQGFVNTHPSLLPHNRGKHYNFWAIVERAPFGVTLHKVTEEVDAGDIIAQKAIAYDWTDTGGTLYVKAQEAMVALFVEAYPAIRRGDVVAIRQQLCEGSFHRASELDAASRIDLDELYSARDLLNRLRARTFSGYPACWFEDDGARYEVRLDIERKLK